MDTLKQPHGYRLTNAKRLVVIAKLVDQLSKGYYSTNQLAKMTGMTTKMVATYRPLADEVIAKQTPDRNVIRNLEIKRTYQIIEMLMQDLARTTEDKIRIGYYNQIAKHSQHLALITGLNIETQVTVDQKQLVIIRASDKHKTVDVTQTTQIP